MLFPKAAYVTLISLFTDIVMYEWVKMKNVKSSEDLIHLDVLYKCNVINRHLISVALPSRWVNWTTVALLSSTQCGRVLTPSVTLNWTTTTCQSSPWRRNLL